MAQVTPPSPYSIDSKSLEQWHRIFKTPWETLVGIGYVDGAERRMWTNRLDDFAAGDGECSLFGEGVLEPEIQVAVPTSNATFYVVSSSSSDTNDVCLWMVNAAGDETVVAITLNGTTPVSIGSYVHCNMSMYEGGHTQNIGNIFVSTKAIAGTPLIITDKVQTHIAIGNGHGNNPCQLCPNDQVFVFGGIDLTVDKNDGVDFRLYRDATMASAEHRMMAQEWVLYNTALSVDHVTPNVITAGQSICLTVSRSAGGSGNVIARANWDQVVLSNETTDSADNRIGSSSLFGV